MDWHKDSRPRQISIAPLSQSDLVQKSIWHQFNKLVLLSHLEIKKLQLVYVITSRQTSRIIFSWCPRQIQLQYLRQTASILHCIGASVSAGGSCYYGRVAAASAESLRAGGKSGRPHNNLPACHLRLGVPAWWEDRRINPALLRKTEVIYGHCVRIICRTNAPGDIHPVYFLSINTC